MDYHSIAINLGFRPDLSRSFVIVFPFFYRQVAQESMLQICTINISSDFINLDDSTKSGKLNKYIPLERISYCGIAR